MTSWRGAWPAARDDAESGNEKPTMRRQLPRPAREPLRPRTIQLGPPAGQWNVVKCRRATGCSQNDPVVFGVWTTPRGAASTVSRCTFGSRGAGVGSPGDRPRQGLAGFDPAACQTRSLDCAAKRGSRLTLRLDDEGHDRRKGASSIIIGAAALQKDRASSTTISTHLDTDSRLPVHGFRLRRVSHRR